MSSTDEQLLDDHRLDECVFCPEIFGIKARFCETCGDPWTYAHRRCIERRMSGSRRIECPHCGAQYCVGYRDTRFDDFVLRAMVGTFVCCLPQSHRNSCVNGIINKHTLALVIAICTILLYIVLPQDADLLLLQAVQTLSCVVSLFALKISTDSAVDMVQMTGNVRRARRHIFADALLVVAVMLLSWATAVKLSYLFTVSETFAIWCIVLQILLVPSLCKVVLYEKSQLARRVLEVEILLYRGSQEP